MICHLLLRWFLTAGITSMQPDAFFCHSLVTNYLKSSSKKRCFSFLSSLSYTVPSDVRAESDTKKVFLFPHPPTPAVIAQSVNLLCRMPLEHKHWDWMCEEGDVWCPAENICMFVYSYKSRWRCPFKDQPCFFPPILDTFLIHGKQPNR